MTEPRLPVTQQLRQGVEQAWTSLAEGWRALSARASGALTRFRRDDRSPAGSSAETFDGFGPTDWGLMAADIRVEDDRVVVRVEAPGMRREDLHIDIDRDQLCVWGEKRVDSEYRDGNYHLVQCAYGSFRRDILLPQAVDAERAVARYSDGVLRIELPRSPSRRGLRIPVREA